MDLATRCLNYLARDPLGRTSRLRDVINGFLAETVDSSHGQVWSKIFDPQREELFTDTLHFGPDGRKHQPAASVLTRSELQARAAGQHLIEVRVNIATGMGSMPDGHLIVIFSADQPLQPNEVAFMEQTLTKLVRDRAEASIGRIHELIINASHQSKDLTSFLHRIIHSVLIPEFYFTGVSIFYHEQKTRSLILGATTGIERQEALQLKRSDVRYFTDEGSYTARCWREGKEIVENALGTNRLKPNRLGETTGDIHSRIYAPLRRWSGRPQGEKLGSVGVLRAINANRDSNFHPLTVLEAARLRVFCDAASVMTERYVRAISILHDQERATHGYNTDLAAIKYAAQNVERWLGRAEQPDLSPANREVALREIRYRIRDILAVQDNMASQIVTVMHHSGGSRLVSKDTDAIACHQPYTDVILRLVAAKKGMSECYGRKELRLTFASNAKADDAFIRIPPLKISVGNLYLVFRNLAENAIKYSRKGLAPQLDISWRTSDGFIEFCFADNGIGIPEHEHHLVMREGFRGRQAQELQLRGNGLGLAVSQVAVEAVGGKLIFQPQPSGEPGARFVVRLPV